MSFAVDVTDEALDSLPQDLSFAALGLLIEELDRLLGIDPSSNCHRVDHPDRDETVNACYGGFEIEDKTYLFTACFYYSLDERSIKIWSIRLTAERRRKQ